MGLLDFLLGKKNNGSMDEQLKREAEMHQQTAMQQEVINNQNVSGDFQMTVEDVFTITGRGTVVTGRITSGRIAVNETVRNRNSGRTYAVAGLEMFRKTLDYAQAGDNVGLLLRGADRESVHRGDILIK